MAWLQQRHGNELPKSHPSPTRITGISPVKWEAAFQELAPLTQKLKQQVNNKLSFSFTDFCTFQALFAKILPCLELTLSIQLPFWQLLKRMVPMLFQSAGKKATSHLLWEGPHFYPSKPLRRWSGGSFQWGWSWEGAKQTLRRVAVAHETDSPPKKKQHRHCGCFCLAGCFFLFLFLEKEINSSFKEDFKKWAWQVWLNLFVFLFQPDGVYFFFGPGKLRKACRVLLGMGGGIIGSMIFGRPKLWEVSKGWTSDPSEHRFSVNLECQAGHFCICECTVMFVDTRMKYQKSSLYFKSKRNFDLNFTGCWYVFKFLHCPVMQTWMIPRHFPRQVAVKAELDYIKREDWPDHWGGDGFVWFPRG